jgi:hypothetical protein
MGLLAALEKLITEHGSAAILRERLAAFRDDVQRFEQRNTQLEAENAELKKERAELTRYLEQQRTTAQFTESKGALWKRTPQGSFSEMPYCPTCERPLSRLPMADMVACTKCGYHPGFKSHQIAQIVLLLNQLET